MVTIKDVASKAKVSPATVSRVLNHTGPVSKEIRDKVEQVIQELGYFPNNTARSLVKRESGCLAVVLRNMHSPYFLPLIKGFEAGAAEFNRKVIFCSLGQDPEYRDSYIRFLTNGISDGIILYGSLYSDQPLITHLSAVHFPFLLIENNYEDTPVNQFLIDNFSGAKDAIQYLIQNHHTKIAHFMGNPNKKVNLERFNGYVSAMQENHLAIKDGYVINVFDHPEAAYLEAQKVMKLVPTERPSAIFCNNDRIAAHAIQGIMDLGFSVPNDISIIAFDNQQLYDFDYTGPRITTIAQPLFDLGYDSIMHLNKILDNRGEEPITKIYKTSLVENQTVSMVDRLQ